MTETTQERFYREIKELGGKTIDDCWINTHTKQRVFDEEGHECWVVPKDLHRLGRITCRICGPKAGANKNSVRSGTEFRYVQALKIIGAMPGWDAWQGTQTKHRVFCCYGHECFTLPSSLLYSNQGICNVCAGNDTEEAERKFLTLLSELGAVRRYSTWRGSHERHEIVAPCGHTSFPRPRDLRNGWGLCPRCSNCDPKQAEEKFLEALELIGAQPAYEKYKGTKERHLVICSAGHECFTVPHNVKAGWGVCVICARKSRIETEKNFRAGLAAMGAVPVYEKYLGVSGLHAIICSAGHHVHTRPDNITQGHGICRLCAGRDHNVFYILGNPILHQIKFGVTKNDPRPRLKKHKREGFTDFYECLESFPGAYDLECKIKLGLAEAGFEPVRGREYFRDDALPFILSMIPDQS